MTEQVLDGKRLSKIAHATRTAEVAATALALRERARPHSNIWRMKNTLKNSGEKIIDSDYMKFWKELQDLGVGTIVYGSRGQAKRFDWHYSLRTVGKAAVEGVDATVEKLAPRRPTRRAQHRLVVPKVVAPRDLPTRMITLPLDLSKTEADALIAAIKTLSTSRRD